MVNIIIHPEVFNDISYKFYIGLGEELPRIFRLLMQEGKLPGEAPVHYLKITELQNKTFHAGINLPKENVGKKKGARVIYIKESFNLIKIIYVGGHRDRKYDNSHYQVALIKERYLCPAENYTQYTEGLIFEA